MKLAIHLSAADFSNRWIAYCEQQGIPFKKVNCYQSGIIEELKDCDALLWHHNHASPTDQLFAKQLLFSLEQSGKVVFPDFYTAWHFDDKLGQKYLFETLKLPHVKSFAFYSKQEALKWISETEFPKVFKLRRGAGARNVRLVKSKNDARKIINKAFGSGFRQYDATGGIKESIRKYRLGKSTLTDILKAFAHIVYPIQLEKAIGKERGYVYFQDFIPDNKYDIRVIVIGNKAFAIKRNVRRNDFRASGSGFIEYEKSLFPDSIVALSFENAKKLNSQCTAFDYVFSNGSPLIVEISYGFNEKGYVECPGYWTSDLVWHEGTFNPYGWMVEEVIAKINEKNQ